MFIYKKSFKKCLCHFNKTFSNYQATYQKELRKALQNNLLEARFAERKYKMNSSNTKC